MTNPPVHTRIEAGAILIAIGTEQQLSALHGAANPTQTDRDPG